MAVRSIRTAGLKYLANRIGRLMPNGSMVAPCYHLVSDDFPVHVRHLYQWRGVKAFETDLEYLLKRFKPISLSEVHAYVVSGRPIPKQFLFLSFDDGFREMAEVVAPLCRKKGVPVTFFLTTAFLGNRALGYRQKASLLIEACKNHGEAATQATISKLCEALGIDPVQSPGARRMLLSVGYRQRHVLDECAALLEVDFDDYLRTARPYLTHDEVGMLLRDGFSIGGHSVDHPLYADLSLNEQIEQTQGCMEELNERYRLPVKAFAFPFVSDGVTDSFYEQVFERQVADLTFCIGRMPTLNPEKAVQRFGVEAEQNIPMSELLARQAEGRLLMKAAGWKRSMTDSISRNNA